MARKSVIQREKKRQKLEQKYHLIRRSSKKETLDNGDEKLTLYEESVRSESRENGGRSHRESVRSERRLS